MARPLLTIVCLCVILSVFAGCQKENKIDSRVDITVIGGGKFPSQLAGRWIDEKRKWEFVFEKDGTISSAVIDSGVIEVRPSDIVTEKPLKEDGKATYKLGRWSVEYSPTDRQLTVETVIDSFRLDLLSYGIEGNSTDWFVGTVSQDYQTWQAQWYSFAEQATFGDERIEFPLDPNNNPVDTLIFRKQ